MNKKETLRTWLSPFTVGFDDWFEDLKKISNQSYPPHNIIKLADDTIAVEMALAGLKKKDLKIVVENNCLTISYTKTEEESTAFEYLHKGIADRQFIKKFMIPKYWEVEGAHMIDGLLKIVLKYFVPEDKKPKEIEIG